jgi:hypothetical protein
LAPAFHPLILCDKRIRMDRHPHQLSCREHRCGRNNELPSNRNGRVICRRMLSSSHHVLHFKTAHLLIAVSTFRVWP